MAAAVTVSFVCDESINAVSVWYRLSFSGAVRQYRSSQPMVSTGAVGLRSRMACTIEYISAQFDGGVVLVSPVVGDMARRAGILGRALDLGREGEGDVEDLSGGGGIVVVSLEDSAVMVVVVIMFSSCTSDLICVTSTATGGGSVVLVSRSSTPNFLFLLTRAGEDLGRTSSMSGVLV